MARIFHGLLLTLYSLLVLFTAIWLGYLGSSYYLLPSEGALRVIHPLYATLRPNGFIGHGLGIVGTALICIGLFSYMARKHLKVFSRWGLLKYWLEIHIFLCSLGFVMVSFHTSFKFGGIASIGYWSLVIVFVSGMAGRFLYIQIPRTLGGREMNMREITAMKETLDRELSAKYAIKINDLHRGRFSELAPEMKKNLHTQDKRKIRKLLRAERVLQGRIKRLELMRKLFHFWHVIHLPFALIMLIIMMIHVGVALYFGYSWIFFK